MPDTADFARFANVTFVQGAGAGGSVIFSPGGAADAPLADVFAVRGLEGGGYDWQSAVHAALVEREPLLERFAFDSEAGMFCAYGEDPAALAEVAATVESLLADPAALGAALDAAAERDLLD